MKNLTIIVFTFFSLSIFSQQLNLLPSSSITVDGTSTISDWTVKPESYTGTLTVSAKKKSKITLKKGTLSTIHLIIPGKSMRSENGETMDSKIFRALKVDDFPNISYTLDRSIEFSVIDKNKRNFSVSGVLTIAGVEKTIQNNLSVIYANGTLSLSGKIAIKLSDFNIEPPSAMFGQIETGDDIIINFILEYENHY
ncbi:MAG: YceI family protein [Flavobacteriaceae bacterium]|nr:YceI family protein [Flavobacteriaceae bacterium]